MTLVAGIFRRNVRDPLQEDWCRVLVGSLSRYPGDQAEEYRSENLFLAWVDVGALGTPPVVRDPSGAVSVILGEPLLTEGTRAFADSHEVDLATLHRACVERRSNVLCRAKGVFSAAHYSPEPARLWLTTDRLGVRPMYFWLGRQYVVFSSVLRTMESLALVPKRLDVRALVEMTSIGIPLGDRTPYADVRRIGPAELVEVGESGDRRLPYWRWDELEQRDWEEEELVAELNARFRTAVRRRNRGSGSAVAFLSGGMDSRSLVAALRLDEVEVSTVGLSIPGTQDYAFSTAFARAAGTLHHNLPATLEVPEAKLSMSMAAALEGPLARDGRPRVVWSGDGGSVGLGHVYVGAEVVRLLRAGAREAAVDTFLREIDARVARRIVRPDLADGFAGIPKEGVLAELAGIRHPDPVRAFHLFLLQNDQRRHLTAHFENIDLHRVEFHLPFFDGDLLELVVSSPIDHWLFHRLYARWLPRLGAAATAVPWQTYPGHEPCPLPVPEELAYQWNPATMRGPRRLWEKRLLADASDLLRTGFPDPLLRKGQLRLARWLHLTGVRDCAHLLRTASTYGRYWKASDRTLQLPGAPVAGATGGPER